MTILSFQQLYENLARLPAEVQNQAEFAHGKMVPVIGEGNCAFRSILQSLLINAAAENIDVKNELINFLIRLYMSKRNAVITEHQVFERAGRDIAYIEFEDFITQFRNAQVADGSLENFFREHFPLSQNRDHTPALPIKDKMIKFLAFCLRIDIVSKKIENRSPFVDAVDLHEDRFFSVGEEEVAYFRGKNIALNIIETAPFFTIGGDVENNLTASIIFDRGQPNGNGEFRNGHYHALFGQRTFNALLQQNVRAVESQSDQEAQRLGEESLRLAQRLYDEEKSLQEARRQGEEESRRLAQRLYDEEKSLQEARRLEAEEERGLQEILRRHQEEENRRIAERSQQEDAPPVAAVSAAIPMLTSFRSLMSRNNNLGYFVVPALCGLLACTYLATKRLR